MSDKNKKSKLKHFLSSSRSALWLAPVSLLVLLSFYAFFSSQSALSQNGKTSENPADQVVEQQVQSAIHIDLEQAAAERTIGSPDAPVTIVEYSSLSCGHCAAFHTQVLPEIKENYVETGKVRFIFKEFPLNAPALKAAVMARCVAPERYYGLIDMLFRNQERWLSGQDFEHALFQFGRLAGLSKEKFDACMVNRELEDIVIGFYQQGVEQWQVNSTPTFIVNDGEKTITGARDYNFFKNVIEGQLKGQ